MPLPLTFGFSVDAVVQPYVLNAWRFRYNLPSIWSRGMISLCYWLELGFYDALILVQVSDG